MCVDTGRWSRRASPIEFRLCRPLHSHFRSASRLAVGPVYRQLGVICIVKHGDALDKSRHVLLQIEMGGVVLEKILAFAGGSESDGKCVRVLALERKSVFASAEGLGGMGSSHRRDLGRDIVRDAVDVGHARVGVHAAVLERIHSRRSLTTHAGSAGEAASHGQARGRERTSAMTSRLTPSRNWNMTMCVTVLSLAISDVDQPATPRGSRSATRTRPTTRRKRMARRAGDSRRGGSSSSSRGSNAFFSWSGRATMVGES